MKISEAGKALIKKYEGVRLRAYKPVPTEKYWTIGYGHYGADVKVGQTITMAQANALFNKDIVKYETPVNNLGMELTQKQFDALVSFCYNCGAGNLQKLCASKNIKTIASNIVLYNKGGGKVLAGLTKRRKEEQAWLLSSGTTTVKTTNTGIAVDGYWGMDTTRALQRVLGTDMDGIIGGQVKNHVTTKIKGVVYGNQHGSQTIKALQKKLGVTADGFLGKETVKAMQKHYKVTVDGNLTVAVVKALQTALNKDAI